MPTNPIPPDTTAAKAEAAVWRYRALLLVTVAGVAAAVMAGPDAAAGVLVGAIVAYTAKGSR